MSSCVADDTDRAPAAPVDLTGMTLEDLMNIEVTSAGKTPQKISETPAAVFVIKHEDIERFGYRTLSQALGRVIGMYVSSDRNYDYLGVRGYGPPGDLNTRILLLVDGHRINDPLFDMAYIDETLPVDMRSVQRIEVVKGPGSALWGTNALLAVINVITKTGCDIDGSRALVDTANGTAEEAYFEYGKRYDNGPDIACSVSGIRSDGQEHIYFPDLNDPSTNNGVAVNMDGEHAKRMYASASYGEWKLLLDGGSRTKTFPTAPYGSLFNDPRTTTIDNRQFSELSYESPVSRGNDGRLSARVYSDDCSFNATYPYSGEVANEVTFDMYRGESSWWGTEIRYSVDASPRLSTVFGLEHQKMTKVRYRNYEMPNYTPYSDTTSSYSLTSGYVQADYCLHPSLRLVAGTRLDDYSTIGGAWSPRCALVYNPNSDSTLKALYGTAFRAPNAYEQAEVQGYVPDLSPEHITTSELIWEQRVGKNSRLVASAFRFDIRDIITEQEISLDHSAYMNTGTVRSQGVELELETSLAGGVTGYAGLALQRAWDAETGAILANSPRFLATGGISVPLLSNKLFISPEVQLIGSRKTLLGNNTRAAPIVNLSVVSRGVIRGHDLSLSVSNLFNTLVTAPGLEGYPEDQIPQQGRVLQLQLSQRL